MRYLVTGGGGFLGSNLCKKLLNEGHQVICIDNFLTSSKVNIKEFLNNENFRLIEDNVIGYGIEDFNLKFDGIFHLASPADSKTYQENLDVTREVNTIATYYLVKLALAQDIPFVYVSSVRVLDEGVESNCYVEAKKIGECICRNVSNNFKIKIARLGNVYGPNLSKEDRRVVTVFITKMLSGEDVTILGRGRQIDSFCYVDDIVDGLYKFIISSTKETILEFGSSEIMSIKYLANIIKELTNSNSNLLFTKEKEDNKVRGIANINKTIKTLDWFPNTRLETGLIKTIEYFKNYENR